MKPFFTEEDFDGAISSTDGSYILKMDSAMAGRSLGYRVYSNVTALANAKTTPLLELLREARERVRTAHCLSDHEIERDTSLMERIDAALGEK